MASAGLPPTFLGRLRYCLWRTNQFNFDTEEVVDFFVHRRTASVIVSLMGALDLPWLFTPNRITLLSMLTGVWSAWCVLQAHADQRYFLYAALLELLSITLDCCDGQLARLYKSGSLLGRVLDGLSDMIVALSHGYAWTYALTYHFGALSERQALLYLAVAVVSFQQQAMMFDRVKNTYCLKTSPIKDQKVVGLEEGAELDREIKQADKHGNLLAYYILLWYKAQYVAVQNKMAAGKTAEALLAEVGTVDPELYRLRWRPQMRLTSWLGTGTHALLFYGLLFAAWAVGDGKVLVWWFALNNGLFNLIFFAVGRKVSLM